MFHNLLQNDLKLYPSIHPPPIHKSTSSTIIAFSPLNLEIHLQIHFIEMEVIIKSMKILKYIENAVKKVDFFYSKEMLRYDDDEDFKTLTGGIVSIGIIIAIIIGFASMILNTLNLTSITTTTQIVKNVIPPPSTIEIKPQSPFRFGVQMWRLNLSDTKRYFDVTFRIDYQTNGIVQEQVSIPLETCTKEYFADYPDIIASFQKLGIGGWLCPPLNTSLNLYGKYSSDSYSQYIITASACNNDTDPSRPCPSPEQIQTFFDQNSNFLYFCIYFTNPQINPDEKDYKQYYFEDEVYVIFGSHLGSETYLYFADYNVETDYSIWPYQHIVNDQGCVVEEAVINHPFQTNINGTYATFNLAKSTNSIIYKREVQKLSSVFSFIGGMIGAVSAVLFILKIYTNLAFEFSIPLQIFKPNKEKQQKVKEKKEDKQAQNLEVSMNFWNFIKYYAYSFTKMIGKPCNWPAMKYADECKEEICKQLDIKMLLKRIIFIGYCLTHIVEDYQLDALQMSRPLQPKQIGNIRKKCESIINSNTLDPETVSKNEMKEKSEMSEIENCLKNEGNISSPVDLMNQTQKKLSVLRKHIIFSKNIVSNQQVECKSSSSGQQEIQIVDIEHTNSKYDSYLEDIFSKLQNKVGDDKILQSKQFQRSSYLSRLRASALQGNLISEKIWKQVDEKVKKRIERQDFCTKQ